MRMIPPREASPQAARIVDANLNRLAEGLKVIEDVVRFGLERKALLRSVRGLRTKLGRDTLALRRQVIRARNSKADPGRGDRFDRTGRASIADVLSANFKRCEESARVLEEILKIDRPRLSSALKQTRFRLYDLERQAVAALGKEESS